jgi:hypothetical protein
VGFIYEREEEERSRQDLAAWRYQTMIQQLNLLLIGHGYFINLSYVYCYDPWTWPRSDIFPSISFPESGELNQIYHSYRYLI